MTDRQQSIFPLLNKKSTRGIASGRKYFGKNASNKKTATKKQSVLQIKL